MRNSPIIHIALLLLGALCACHALRHQEEERSREVHLSLDDVDFFADLIRYSQDYDSLFQHPLMAFLQELHREYGIKITLYTFERYTDGQGELRIDGMPLKFRDDFRKSADWLRIGFHSPRAKFDSLVTVADFKNSYDNVNLAIARFADSSMVASTLRLHCFFAPDSLLNALTGVRTFLCADDSNRVSYNLSASESKVVDNGGTIVKKDISYRRTDLRIDDNFLILDQLKSLGANDTLVIFAHNWKLWHPVESMNSRSTSGRIKLRASDRVNRRLFKETVKWLNDAEYKFSFIE